MLSHLAETDSSDFDGALALALASSDLHGTFKILDFVRTSPKRDAKFADAIELAAQRHGADVLRLRDVFGELDRRARVRALRGAVLDAHLRFFLALLMTVPTQAGIMAAISARYPEEDPFAAVLKWAQQLSGLDLSGVEFDAPNLEIFRCLISGMSFERALDALRDVFEFDDTDDEASALREQYQALRETLLFQPLFVEALS